MNGEKLWKVSFLQHIMSFYKFPFPFPVHVVFTACSFNMIINNPQSSFNCFLFECASYSSSFTTTEWLRWRDCLYNVGIPNFVGNSWPFPLVINTRCTMHHVHLQRNYNIKNIKSRIIHLELFFRLKVNCTHKLYLWYLYQLQITSR